MPVATDYFLLKSGNSYYRASLVQVEGRQTWSIASAPEPVGTAHAGFDQGELNISQAELDDLKAALANNAVNDPWPNMLSEAEEKVRQWTAAYVVPEATLQRLWRPMVLFNIYGLAGTLTKQRQTDYDDAMKELSDIRDGKFKMYDPNPIQPAGIVQSAGAFGGDAVIATR